MVKEHIPQILPFDQINWPPARPEGLRTLPLDGIDPMPRPQDLKAPSDPIAIEQTEQKCDRVLFILIGGAGDGGVFHQNVQSTLLREVAVQHKKFSARMVINFYKHNQTQGILNRISNACEEYIVVIAHSWGTGEAIRAVGAASKQVDYLVTLDAVGMAPLKPWPSQSQRQKAKGKIKEQWVNVWVDISEKTPLAGNDVAAAGGHKKKIDEADQNIYLGNLVGDVTKGARYSGDKGADHAIAYMQYADGAALQIQQWLEGVDWE